jgi:hypothetical protein
VPVADGPTLLDVGGEDAAIARTSGAGLTATVRSAGGGGIHGLIGDFNAGDDADALESDPLVSGDTTEPAYKEMRGGAVSVGLGV